MYKVCVSIYITGLNYQQGLICYKTQPTKPQIIRLQNIYLIYMYKQH